MSSNSRSLGSTIRRCNSLTTMSNEKLLLVPTPNAQSKRRSVSDNNIDKLSDQESTGTSSGFRSTTGSDYGNSKVCFFKKVLDKRG